MAREKTKREDILAAAAKIFGSRGFYLANMADIAEEAGIGKGTVYEYFDSKSSLFIETLKYKADLYRKTMEERINGQEGFRNKLDIFIKTHWEIVRENIKSASIMMINPSDINLTDESIRGVIDFLLDERSRIAELLSNIVEIGRIEGVIGDIDVEFASDMLLDMILRYGMRGVLKGLSDEQMQREKEKLIDLFVNGAGMPGKREWRRELR